jgi:DNA-directed RNA polymerase specialized sigma24 family protein
MDPHDPASPAFEQIFEETAEALEVSVDTVKRDWRMARAWLIAELAGKQEPARS